MFRIGADVGLLAPPVLRRSTGELVDGAAIGGDAHKIEPINNWSCVHFG